LGDNALTGRIVIKGTVVRRKTVLTLVSISIILALIFGYVINNSLIQVTPTEPKIFVGVDIGFGNETVVYNIADTLEGYANLIILGSLTITNDTPTLTRVCDYLYEKGFYFIIYVGFAMEGYLPPRGPDQNFFNSTINKWGNKFLGAYFFDEVGGKQIDQEHPVVIEAQNFSDAANEYINLVNNYLVHYKTYFYGAPKLRLFTSDYALNWFDYLSGYDIVLGEFVANQSRQIAVAQNRGAANTLQHEWGIMITYSKGKLYGIPSTNIR